MPILRREPLMRKSFEVVGYTYNADTHCVNCTLEYVCETNPKMADDIGHHMHLGIMVADEDGHVFYDSEGNEVYPIFLDQVNEDDVCGDCGEGLE
jgi:hypothetical protein